MVVSRIQSIFTGPVLDFWSDFVQLIDKFIANQELFLYFISEKVERDARSYGKSAQRQSYSMNEIK